MRLRGGLILLLVVVAAAGFSETITGTWTTKNVYRIVEREGELPRIGQDIYPKRFVFWGDRGIADMTIRVDGEDRVFGFSYDTAIPYKGRMMMLLDAEQSGIQYSLFIEPWFLAEGQAQLFILLAVPGGPLPVPEDTTWLFVGELRR